jgi:hypothetical protein
MNGVKPTAGIYRREDYDRIRGIMQDSGTLPATYEEYRANVDRHLAEAKAQGVEFELVTIEPDAFLQFCRETRLPPNSMARATFCTCIAEGRTGPPWPKINVPDHLRKRLGGKP